MRENKLFNVYSWFLLLLLLLLLPVRYLKTLLWILKAQTNAPIGIKNAQFLRCIKSILQISIHYFRKHHYTNWQRIATFIEEKSVFSSIPLDVCIWQVFKALSLTSFSPSCKFNCLFTSFSASAFPPKGSHCLILMFSWDDAMPCHPQWEAEKNAGASLCA